MQQMIYQSPTLLVLVVGIVAAILGYKRSPMASVFCLLGCGLMLLTALGVSGMQTMILNNRNTDMGSQQFNSMMSVVSLLGSVARAVGLGLIIAAVFVGRERPRDEF